MSRLTKTEYVPDHITIERTLSFLNLGRFGSERLDENNREELRMLVDEWLAADANWALFRTAMLKKEWHFLMREPSTYSPQGMATQP